jgi:hypothetical protein
LGITRTKISAENEALVTGNFDLNSKDGAKSTLQYLRENFKGLAGKGIFLIKNEPYTSRSSTECKGESHEGYAPFMIESDGKGNVTFKQVAGGTYADGKNLTNDISPSGYTFTLSNKTSEAEINNAIVKSGNFENGVMQFTQLKDSGHNNSNFPINYFHCDSIDSAIKFSVEDVIKGNMASNGESLIGIGGCNGFCGIANDNTATLYVEINNKHFVINALKPNNRPTTITISPYSSDSSGKTYFSNNNAVDTVKFEYNKGKGLTQNKGKIETLIDNATSNKSNTDPRIPTGVTASVIPPVPLIPVLRSAVPVPPLPLTTTQQSQKLVVPPLPSALPPLPSALPPLPSALPPLPSTTTQQLQKLVVPPLPPSLQKSAVASSALPPPPALPPLSSTVAKQLKEMAEKQLPPLPQQVQENSSRRKTLTANPFQRRENAETIPQPEPVKSPSTDGAMSAPQTQQQKPLPKIDFNRKADNSQKPIAQNQESDWE